MLIGHQSLSILLDQYLAKFQGGSENLPFLIISGPKHIGKMTLIQDKIRGFLGLFTQQDSLILQDLSEYLGKDHVFKVEIDEKEQMLEIDGHGTFLEMGARQLNRWLQLAPAGDHKVLVIENIERMNGASANAFLKSLEEPLPGRIIIATTSNLERVLPTIQSRALLFRTQAPRKESAMAYLQEQFPLVSVDSLDALRSYHQGAIGSLVTALQSGKLEYLESYQALIKAWGGSNARLRYSLLQELYKRPGGEKILDVLLAREGASLADRQAFLQAKKLLTSNISDENVVFGLGYSCI